jgi:hypothetical protein
VTTLGSRPIDSSSSFAADLVVAGEPSASVPSAALDVRGVIEFCHGSPQLARVALSVGSKTSLERVVDLSDVRGELRVRTLAVVFGEMLGRLPALAETNASSDAQTSAGSARPGTEDLAALPPEAKGADDATEQGPSTSGERASTSRWRVGSGISLRSYTQPQTTFVGPWLSLEFGVWQTEALFLTTSEDVTTGTVRVHDVVAALGWAPLRFGTAVRAILGVRAELGMSWAVGSPGANSHARGDTQRRARVALLAEPRIDVPLSSAISAEARLSAGIAQGPTATADHRPVATSGGPFVGTSLGLQLGF